MAKFSDNPALTEEPPGARWGARARQRWASLAIALAMEALIVALLLTISARIGRDTPKEVVTEFAAKDFAAAPEPAPEAPPEPAAEAASPPQPQPEPDRPATPDLPEPVRPPSPLISNPTPAPAPPPAPPAPPAPSPAPTIGARINPNRNYGPADTGPPRTSMDSERVGTAPNGEPLYAARWYREPTHQELAGYLSTATGPGFALIACKTVEGYYVEDCELLSEGPAGSQMGRAVLAAAWQFRVRPARIGGREQFGSWVRIRIDYTLGQGPR
ncbi:MAG: hypothetical protein GC147_02580 [Porphyrobacter sp.]|nr:hypothetical protein [Porphyrobacter sp.]